MPQQKKHPQSSTPLTVEILKEELAKLATKEEVAKLATKVEILELTTKEEMAKLATKEEVAKLATKVGTLELTTKDEMAKLATKKDLKKLLTKKEFEANQDVIADSFLQVITLITNLKEEIGVLQEEVIKIRPQSKPRFSFSV